MTSSLGADISHFQGTPDFARVKASGRNFVVLKATEGTTYLDATLATNRRNAHAAGLIVGLYHFARAGDAAAEARWFLSKIGTLQAGEFLVLDWEVPGANPPAWCKTWLDTVYAATGVRPLIYMNQSAVNGSNWSAVARDYGLWLAKYDQVTSQPTVAHWGGPAMKQYYDKGVVPGIAGPCDVNVFFGTPQQLLAYGKGGSPTPTPTPTPTPAVQEDDMRMIQQTDRGIAVVGPGYYKGLAPEDLNVASAMYGAAVVFSTPADFDRAVAIATGGGSLGDLHGKIVDSRLPFSDREGGSAPDADDMLGHILSTRAEVADLATALAKVQVPTLDATKLAAALLADDAAVAKLGEAIAAGLASRVGNG